ncbi:hypothetical protein [Hoylesella oralis]|uniref:hypothetical protein n=1 Tax=Hoylesella oralis TaxID=28134 RepID=UPI003618838F
MMFFHNRKPRGFHHKFIYVDERQDRLRQIEKTARQGLGLTDGGEEKEKYSSSRTFGSLRRTDRACNRNRGMGCASYIAVLIMIFGLCMFAYYIMYNKL